MRIGPSKGGVAVVTGISDVVGGAVVVAAAVLAVLTDVEDVLRLLLFAAASAGTMGSTAASPTAAVATIPIVRRRRWTVRFSVTTPVASRFVVSVRC